MINPTITSSSWLVVELDDVDFFWSHVFYFIGELFGSSNRGWCWAVFICSDSSPLFKIK